MAKLAFWRTVADAYLFVFAHPLRPLRIGGAPVILYTLYRVTMVAPWLPSRVGVQFILGYMLVQLCVFLLFAAGFISFSVGWHRAVLFGETRPWWAVLRFRRREGRFLGNALLVAVLLGVPSIAYLELSQALLAAAVMGGPGGIARALHYGQWWLICTWIFSALLWVLGSRLSLVFPAVAADERDALSPAWERAGGNWLSLYVGSLLCYLPFMVIEMLVPVLIGAKVTVATRYLVGGGVTFSLVRGGGLHDAVATVIGLIELAVIIAYYSFAYRQLVGAAAPSGDATPQALPAG